MAGIQPKLAPSPYSPQYRKQNRSSRTSCWKGLNLRVESSATKQFKATHIVIPTVLQACINSWFDSASVGYECFAREVQVEPFMCL